MRNNFEIIAISCLIFAVASNAKNVNFKHYCRNVDNDAEHYECSNFEFTTFDHVEFTSHDASLSTADLVQFNNCTMRRFPKNFFKKFHWVVNLKINNCKLKSITIPDPNDNLDNLNRIIELNYRSNKLDSIPDEYFGYFTALTKIDLSSNNFKIITNNTFKGTTPLRMLYLESNAIKEIENGAFNNMPNLTTLDLSDNLLEKLDATIFQSNSNIQILLLNNNNIKFLPNELFQNLKRVDYLRLDNNPLSTQTYTEFLFNLPVLNYLNLSNVDIHMNTEMFLNTPNLEILDISRNKLTTINTHTFKSLKKLDELFINDNELKTFAYNDTVFKKHEFTLEIANNPWDCAHLKSMMKYFHENHIVFHTENFGLHCSGEYSDEVYVGNSNEAWVNNKSEKHTAYIVVIVLLVLVSIASIATIVVLVMQPRNFLRGFRRSQNPLAFENSEHSTY